MLGMFKAVVKGLKDLESDIVFEISGDFAILLKSGLTFRQAVAYNFASAIISYIGLVLGIIIGDIQSAHSWVLALTAGMFLYISLVDMVSQVHFLIQTESIRKLSNFNFQWTKTLYQNILSHIALLHFSRAIDVIS